MSNLPRESQDALGVTVAILLTIIAILISNFV
jgi:hypothetical protein